MNQEPASHNALHDGEFAALDTLAFAYGVPAVQATIKQEFADFRVDEELGFDCTGSGEHLYLRVSKRDLSTTDVARRLQAVTEVPPAAIGYAGMKDRRGECTQWFSVQLPAGAESRIAALADANLEVLETHRNGRKLQIGSLKQNHFQLRLRNCTGDPAEFTDRLRRIQASGIPNYFGAQRFGRDLGNLAQVQALMESVLGVAGASGRKATGLSPVRRGMLFSAARSYLFNLVLSRRVTEGTWSAYVPGDVPNLAGTDRCFGVAAGQWDATLERRLQEFDIHLTGPLAGAIAPKDKYISHGEAADIEDAVLGQYPTLVAGLIRCGLTAARRPLRCLPGHLEWEWEASTILCLRFSLPRGCYATSLLRELCKSHSPDHEHT